MALVFGIVVFAFGILISVLLHEAGHMGTAKAFGMKVTRCFVGFGPTLWSFRRGESEYGVKPLPFGAFVKIVGMTPQDDDVEPGDEQRAMWRFPGGERTIVMGGGAGGAFCFPPLPRLGPLVRLGGARHNKGHNPPPADRAAPRGGPGVTRL